MFQRELSARFSGIITKNRGAVWCQHDLQLKGAKYNKKLIESREQVKAFILWWKREAYHCTAFYTESRMAFPRESNCPYQLDKLWSSICRDSNDVEFMSRPTTDAFWETWSYTSIGGVHHRPHLSRSMLLAYAQKSKSTTGILRITAFAFTVYKVTRKQPILHFDVTSNEPASNIA